MQYTGDYQSNDSYPLPLQIIRHTSAIVEVPATSDPIKNVSSEAACLKVVNLVSSTDRVGDSASRILWATTWAMTPGYRESGKAKNWFTGRRNDQKPLFIGFIYSFLLFRLSGYQ
jgi:hypothetical protein